MLNKIDNILQPDSEPATDQAADESLPELEPDAYVRMTPEQRMLSDLYHFGLSMGHELRGVIEAAPGFATEILRNGIYPSYMNYRRLPRKRINGDLGTLKKLNPEWNFRPGFDPDDMVIVFMHGYVDNTGADRIAYKLADMGYRVYLVRYPFLRSVRRLAEELSGILEQIRIREGDRQYIPIGHSLGGFIWDELLLENSDIVRRYRMPLYIPLGSPHFGTLAAHLGVGRSAREMKPRSQVVLEHLSRRFPSALEVYPFVSRYDILVLPIETSLLKGGINYILSETGHVAQIIKEEIAMAIDEVLSSSAQDLRERATRRPFYPSALMNLLSKLPHNIQRKLGMDGPIEYVMGGSREGEPPEFLLRIVHHEIHRNTLPQLIRPWN